MKSTRDNSVFEEKDSFILKFFKMKYSAKYDTMIWVFDPITAFISAEKLSVYKTKLAKAFMIF